MFKLKGQGREIAGLLAAVAVLVFIWVMGGGGCGAVQ